MACLRCGKEFYEPHARKPHDIPYGKKGSAMFPLCEQCWQEEDVQGRKRYVSKLLFIWFRDGASIREIIKIEKEVYKKIDKQME